MALTLEQVKEAIDAIKEVNSDDPEMSGCLIHALHVEFIKYIANDVVVGDWDAMVMADMIAKMDADGSLVQWIA